MSFLDDFAAIIESGTSKTGILKKRDQSPSVIDKKLHAPTEEEITRQRAEEDAITGPTIGPVSIDPIDYVGPGTFAKIGAGIGKALGSVAIVGAMSPKAFLQKNPEFAGTIFKDAEGNIKELYHGTSKDKDFKKFAENKRGTFVGESPKQASDYALENDSMGFDTRSWPYKPKNTASQVKPLYVNVQSPYYLEGEELAKYVRSSNYAKAQRELMETAKRLGHDAVIYPDGGIAVASPKQIKSSLTGD